MSTSSKRTYKKTTVKIFWNRILPVSKNQIVWSNENYINCYDFILSLLIPCSARRAPYTFFAVYLLHFFHFKWMLINFRFIKNEWVNRFDWIDNSIDSMNLFNEIHFIIVDHFQFYKQYSCNSCEAMLFNNQFKRGQKKNYICPQTVEQGEIILPSRSIHSSVIIGNLKE